MTAEDSIAIAEEDEDTFFASEEELENILAKMLAPFFTDILRSWGRGLHSNLPETIKKLLVQKALAEAKGNQVQAAKMLGINRNLLCNQIDKYKIQAVASKAPLRRGSVLSGTGEGGLRSNPLNPSNVKDTIA